MNNKNKKSMTCRETGKLDIDPNVSLSCIFFNVIIFTRIYMYIGVGKEGKNYSLPDQQEYSIFMINADFTRT